MSSKSATIIEGPETLVLFSYTTAVAYFNKRTKEVFVTDTKHSRTTSRHISAFLNEHITGKLLSAYTPKVIPQEELTKMFPLNVKGL